MSKKIRSISTSQDYFAVTSLTGRIKGILPLIQDRWEVKIKKKISESDYFGSGKVGTMHFLVDDHGQDRVLKIQGIQPSISEAEILQKFKENNQSQLIRLPYLYKYLPWDEELGFEALLMEYVQADLVIETSQIATQEQLQQFFSIYQNYQRYCQPKPWIDHPDLLAAKYVEKRIDKFIKLSKELKPDHPEREAGDIDLVKEAQQVLVDFYQLQQTKLSFQHGHLSVHNVRIKDDKVILLANLFWKWLPPYFDLVFAYHWFMYSLSGCDVSETELSTQRRLWLKEMQKQTSDEKLFKAALLERAVAGLLNDAFAYTDAEQPLMKILVKQTRQQVKELTKFLR